MYRFALFIGLIFGVTCQDLTIEEFEEQHNCKCVMYYLCDENNNINVNGRDNLIDIRSGSVERLPCPSQGNTTQVCCYLSTTRDTPDPTPKPNTSTKSPVITVITVRKNVTCGVQRPSINVRILSDEFSNTIAGEFPWMAAVYRKSKFKCTGTLIHPQVILTVAHYVKRADRSDYRVVVNGETQLGGEKSDHERSVIDVIRHPDFYSGGLFNDIALLFLNEPYEITQFGTLINEICLPSEDQIFDGKSCIVAGWSNKDTTIPLKKVVVPFLPHGKCQTNLRKYSKLGPTFNLHTSFTCAGGIEGQDACLGDGGSPLMCAIDNVFHVVGLVSWGQGCSQANVPGVYTDVSKFRGWIKDEIIKKNLKINI